jgi:hypothetical protein
VTSSSAPSSGNLSPSSGLPLTSRDRAVLVAVANGRCHVEPGPLPYLTIDRCAACDQLAAYQLLAGGLIEAASAGLDGRTRARLTDAGRAAIAMPRHRD